MHIIVKDLIACYVLWCAHLTFPFQFIFIPDFLILTVTFLVLSYINPLPSILYSLAHLLDGAVLCQKIKRCIV